jgi:hypothetical protein
MVVLEIYAMGEPTGAKFTVEPATVQAIEQLPGKPRASKVVFKNGTYRTCVGDPEEVMGKLGKQ